MDRGSLFRPAVGAAGASAHVVQLHLLLSPPRLRLEEDGLVVAALGAVVVLAPWQCGV